ncbi:hypothetical protein F5887DRAFT_1075496 [Amanita rubescens]|nr:hypothetical protein F5887DRAFT_1075496 [Amanita rubescens]
MTGIRTFNPDVPTHPVYISEPLVFLSLSSLFEQQNSTSRKNWMVRSFRTAVNRSSLGFVLEEALLLAIQLKPTPNLVAKVWQEALNSVTPDLFYMVVVNGKQGQYAPVPFPNLENDLKSTLETILGKGDAPKIAETYRSQYRDKLPAAIHFTLNPTDSSCFTVNVSITLDAMDLLHTNIPASCEWRMVDDAWDR